MNEYELYENGFSIPDISNKTGIPKSTLRFRFKKAGILRSRSDAVALAGEQGKLGGGMRGKSRIFSESHKENISKAKKGKGRGVRITQSGYIEYTMGENKGRSVHVVLIEREIGRRLFSNECVHHIDEDRANNEIDNLQLMTRAEHASHHRKTEILNGKNRRRNKNGTWN